MAREIFTSLRDFAQSISSGEKSASELSSSVNHWMKESGEAMKEKIESEIESAAVRMGFVKKAELELLVKRVEVLESKLITAKQMATRRVKKASVKKASGTKKEAK